MKQWKKGLPLLAGGLALTISLTACSSSAVPANGESADWENAVTLLQAIWQKDDQSEKPMIFGGVGEYAMEGEPAALDLSDASLISSSLMVPETLVDESESAASLMNAMMANYLTASVWELKEDENVQDVADELADYIADAQWLCAMPEEYFIASEGQYLIVAYGLTDALDPLLDASKEVCLNLDVLHTDQFYD